MNDTLTPDPRPRDRARTEAALVAAARDLLAESGFQNFGINAVARRAGCDKQLIYRYFGGLDGLIDAIGGELADWIVDRLATDAAPPASYRQLAERLIFGFMAALRADMLVQKIMTWEIADPSPMVMRLAQARSKALTGWMLRQRGDLAPPDGCDAAAVNAALIGAVQMMVLSASASGAFAGMPLRADADWQRLAAALGTMLDAVYGPG